MLASPSRTAQQLREQPQSVGQLGTATALGLASRASASWQRFWCWLGLVASGKTLLECLGMLLPPTNPVAEVLSWSSLALVLSRSASLALWGVAALAR